ncbi:uncharacterized protein LOC123267535 [Cotesia glomerata]|uniref:Uncharacterized protein n=1 Tax=Cotesia glomerata TaxID=32391 RepID=A0AAV7HQR7_COTGL|nr:uncharacterized protein LOC123267535 [Cotesia glomerata]KAH0534405.1 hypothetical protein KQX54_003651 [Cotesia glomerata]
MKNLILAFVTIFSVITAIARPVSENLSYECLESSVKLNFKRKSPLHEVTLNTNLFRVKECNRKFSIDEPTIMEINFDKCTLGAKNFFINVEEFKPGEIDSLLYSLPVYCENLIPVYSL